MRFIILSKENARKFISPHRYAVIGIVCNDDCHPLIQEGYVDRLELKFYDIDFNTPIFPSMNSNDAIEILEFVEKNKNKVDMFVIHCNAGISRSSGTAAALSLIYNDDDSWVFSNPKYMPNMMVYRTILTEAEKLGLL